MGQVFAVFKNGQITEKFKGTGILNVKPLKLIIMQRKTTVPLSSFCCNRI